MQSVYVWYLLSDEKDDQIVEIFNATIFKPTKEHSEATTRSSPTNLEKMNQIRISDAIYLYSKFEKLDSYNNKLPLPKKMPVENTGDPQHFRIQ